MKNTSVEVIVLRAEPGVALHNAITDALQKCAEQHVNVSVKHNGNTWRFDYDQLLRCVKEVKEAE